MTAITILDQANTPTGPFTREQVAEKLKSGEVTLESLAFVEGLTQWTPLRDVLAKVDAAAPPPVAVAPVFTPPPTPAAGAPAYSYAATMQPPGHLVYAGFWLRFVAYFIDGFIIGIPITIVFMILGGIFAGFAAASGGFPHTTGDSDPSQTFAPAMGIGFALIELVIWAAFMVLTWFYFAKLESGPHQATYGKRALGLKVTNLSGEPIGFGQASGRFFGKIVSGMTFYIGFIMAGFTQRKQALHDLIAGTLVVKK
jgi:uncharacterized RDD family membrane protein YckC